MGRAEESVSTLHDDVPTPLRPQRSEANSKKELHELKEKFAAQAAELAQVNKEKSRLQTQNRTISSTLKTKDAALKSKEAEYAIVSKTAQNAAERFARLQAKYNSTACPVAATVSAPITEFAETITAESVFKRNREQLEYHRANDIEMERAALSQRNERHVRSEAIKDNDQARRRDNIALAVSLSKGDPAYTALLLEHMEHTTPNP